MTNEKKNIDGIDNDEDMKKLVEITDITTKSIYIHNIATHIDINFSETKNSEKKTSYLNTLHLMLINFLNTYQHIRIEDIDPAANENYKQNFFLPALFNALKADGRLCPNFIEKESIEAHLVWQALFESYYQRNQAVYYFIILERDNKPFKRFFVDVGFTGIDYINNKITRQQLKNELIKHALKGRTNTNYTGTSAGWITYKRLKSNF